MKRIALYLWQLPQHLLALAVWGILSAGRRVKSAGVFQGCTVVQTNTQSWGVSLGNYIFLDSRYSEETLKHEYGHSLQSRRWGPLYLFVVGIPSAVFNNLWDRLFHKKWTTEQRYKWYYSRYPEKQADELGAVSRYFDHDE